MEVVLQVAEGLLDVKALLAAKGPEGFCRWSTYDSLRLGREPITDVPATVTEMDWASPVWVKASVH
ncbi:MAG TPA: DUF3604 domain-containing protein [Verrucomicrobiales bacterium]|nr:DUF3604 domain-containing protein [Verrucomicrobiales bacterium]HIL70678.1 DUF3604 domain-containing protein [Verrucomicrobiota bacterium]